MMQLAQGRVPELCLGKIEIRQTEVRLTPLAVESLAHEQAQLTFQSQAKTRPPIKITA